jgi:hypothetical protein
MIINRVNIRTDVSANNHSGHRELIATGVFTDLLAVHDGLSRSVIPKMSRSKTEQDPELGNLNHEKDSPGEINLRKKIFESMELNALSIFSRKGLFVFTPLQDIKEYYGSAVAFYFAWLSFYTAWTCIFLLDLTH